MKLSRILAASAVALLAAPAAASAHPGVYTVTQKVLQSSDTCRLPDDSCIADATRTQYAVGNDGWANSFTEGNKAPAGRGLLNYKAMPGTWRGTDRAAILDYARSHQNENAVTDLQAHATCLGAAWDTPTNILAWQEDPFFNYIPWQKTSAGLGDQPDKWIGVVKDLTGIDLSTLNGEDQFRSACTTAGGTYYVADVAASITSALETAIKTPLQDQITTLQTGMASLQAAKNTVDAQFAAAEAARQALVARPLTLTLSAKKFSKGAAMVTGPANAAAAVRMRVTSATAKELHIARTIMTRTVNLGAPGAALVNLTPKSSAARKLRAHGHAQKVTVEVTSGGRTQTAAGSLAP